MSITIILIKAAQLILSLSILVILHEFGHYITARIFGCRVEKFYLFFDPWFSLFKKKIKHTEYGIGWLPLGGYVKISGMIDESMDKEQMKKEPQPWEFRSKPAWQRLIVMVAGVTMNLLLAFFIFAMILWVWGEQRVPMNSLKYGVECADPLAYQLGFKDGDRILAVNGDTVQYFEDLNSKMIYADSVKVQRGDSVFMLNMPVNLVERIISSNKEGGLFIPAIPAIVDSIPSSSEAKEAGLQKNDHIIAVNGQPTPFFGELKKKLDTFSDQDVNIMVMRQQQIDTLNMHVSDKGTLGFYALGDYEKLEDRGLLKLQTKKYGFFAAFPAGVNLAIDKLGAYIKSFKLIFQPSTGAYKGLGGFGSIAKAFAPTWDWQVFWVWTAILSLILAFMNILPIPALDGGHVLFLLYEMVSGRKPSEKFLEYAQIAGMVILLALILFANGMDVWRGIKGWLGH